MHLYATQPYLIFNCIGLVLKSNLCNEILSFSKTSLPLHCVSRYRDLCTGSGTQLYGVPGIGVKTVVSVVWYLIFPVCTTPVPPKSYVTLDSFRDIFIRRGDVYYVNSSTHLYQKLTVVVVRRQSWNTCCCRKHWIFSLSMCIFSELMVVKVN